MHFFSKQTSFILIVFPQNNKKITEYQGSYSTLVSIQLHHTYYLSFLSQLLAKLEGQNFYVLCCVDVFKRKLYFINNVVPLGGKQIAFQYYFHYLSMNWINFYFFQTKTVGILLKKCEVIRLAGTPTLLLYYDIVRIILFL